MRFLFSLYCFCIFFFPFYSDGIEDSYWESLSPNEQARIVRSSCPLALAFYSGSFKPSDNNETFSLLEYLTTWDGSLELYPLKFYLFNRIVLTADGALSEVLGEYCIRWFNYDSPYVLRYLQNQRKLENDYMLLMGFDFSFESYDSFNLFYNSVLTQFEEGQKDYPLHFLENLKKISLSLRD